MRIFISQPMTGRTESEIMHERECIINEIKSRNADVEIDFVATTYDRDHARKHPLDMLGNCIKKLAQADKVLFVKGWEKSNGCRIEHMCAVTYGIPCMYIDHWKEIPIESVYISGSAIALAPELRFSTRGE